MTIGDDSMSPYEIRIGDMLIMALEHGEIRPEDVPQILANAALRALDDRGAYYIGGCREQCCALISTQPGHVDLETMRRMIRP